LTFLIVGFMAVRGRGGVVGKWLATGVAYIGFVGAFLTIYLSPWYAPTINFFANWYIATNLLAHSLLLLGCLYLFIGKFVVIKVSNFLPILAVGAVFSAIGGLGVSLCLLFQWDLTQVNPMYIFQPFGDIYPLYGYVLFPLTAVAVVVWTLFYEFCFVKTEHRFYKNWTKDYWLYK
ncbi:MAG: hypothetical protein LBQ05_03270, partial [Christensenellaceae bacterium]|jgi:hypothetical protein|nr:hypothetical protein [Christensenellaceae bacterium]